MDRQTSRLDTTDALTSRTYRSCSSLAVASFAEWASYLTDGKSNTTPPSGKTNLATCGVLTAGVSSRVSKAGRAFATLQLGDLARGANSGCGSGPSCFAARSASANTVAASVTVFLFGDAVNVLRTKKRYLQPGWAVGILDPSLMPDRSGDSNKGSSSTAVTLSVNDPRQILLVGRAADVHRCRGTVRKRVASEHGGTSWEDVRCSTLVDTRVGGGYCPAHRRQGLSSGNGAGSKKGNSATGGMTFMQRQRMGTAPGASGFQQTSQHKKQASSRGLSLTDALAQSGVLEPCPTMATDPLRPHKMLKRAPLHMTKAMPPPSKPRLTAAPATMPASNPYASKKRIAAGAAESGRGVEDILGEALGRKKARTSGLSAITKRKASSNKAVKVFHTEGFDGEVQVPKPSTLFNRRVGAVAAAQPANASRRVSEQSIRERQRGLADILRKNGGSLTTVPSGGVARTRKDPSRSTTSTKILDLKTSKVIYKPKTRENMSQRRAVGPQNNFAAAFGGGEPLDSDKILNAKSRFDGAVMAHNYAKARAAVQELEASESKQDEREVRKKANEKRKSGDGSIVTTGWTCRTCQKKTTFKPASCIAARHDVRQQRELKNDKRAPGTRKERLDRHDRDSADGGLKLGSGIEWSWNRGGF